MPRRGARVPGVHLLHISKTGGTSLKKFLRQNNIDHTADGRRLVVHPHATRLSDVLGRDQTNQAAFFLRDPVSRFVSGFNDRLRQSAPKAFVPWTREEKVAFGHFQTPNDLAEALSAPDPVHQDRAFSATDSIFHTRLHYTDWLRNPEYLGSRIERILFVGFQETYDEDIGRFLTMIGVDASLHPEHSNQAPDDDQRELSEPAQENLRRWYADDIELYEWALARRERWTGDAAAGRLTAPT